MTVMSYLTHLDWVKSLPEYSAEQQKILLALSDERYKWRARERLADVTGLTPAELDANLAALLQKGLVKPSFSKQRTIIYGLKERVLS